MSAGYQPGFSDFASQAQAHQVVPVYRQLLADHLTPVTAFEVLGRDSHAFLLESVVGGERVARHSFIATSPRAVYTCMLGKASVIQRGQARQDFETTDPLGDLAKLMPCKKAYRNPRLPTFTGGLVGYAGYDTIRYYESEKLTAAPTDDRHLPDVCFGLYGELVVFDHVDKTIKVIANAEVSIGASQPEIEKAYEEACRRVDVLVRLLQQPASTGVGEINPHEPLTLTAQSNMTRLQFEDAVRAAQQYIKAGDIFQVVPSQRFRVTSPAHPFEVYRALRVVNPSPFMFYLKTPSCVLIGASPEILCRVQDGVVTSRPLAGTRKRGATEAEDAKLEADLLADPKERAEHIMLVDLHRNDIGRVSEVGSVKVSDAMTVERYSHVMHITTHVTGKLAHGLTAWDALRVSLPVGTVSGAPKIRAMQIIDELEPTRRGPYGGAVGYCDFSGNMDTCIALRTMVHRQGQFDIQAGCGVVADSIPSAEYEETASKAKALLLAVQLAGKGF